ncbi:hypothetical protein BamMEX5DRAFT_3238 [Burkholderia ambifaria MEX-5]|uniref:Helix-turn-helix domain-containing protein n=1 Tax=Burkholderia ambifaria MEX-5 TaxID=396597 RepID=B1T622_9BURK|nr:hypothetical protein BamMEX5DRAFT_3238 [Burkholderia ambifaria MEX-5]
MRHASSSEPRSCLQRTLAKMTRAIAVTVAVGESTVYRTKRRFVEMGLEAALNEQARPGAQRKLSGKEEALLLIATACTDPPPGR